IDRYSSDGPKDVKIPTRLGGHPVTTIFIYHDATGRNPIGAFQGRGLTSVEIPDTVTRIEDNAFSWNNLQEVTIPASVTYVGRAAFWGNQGTNTATQKPEQFIIRGVRGSAAEAYAKSYGHTFIAIP
ncbi:MAG TPA: leucine-rich repeat protein, partial [Syntrophomonadaceae bacterium]|nr:leucine-rich repeat protein [Syntrophomonadaceae bacterium]